MAALDTVDIVIIKNIENSLIQAIDQAEALARTEEAAATAAAAAAALVNKYENIKKGLNTLIVSKPFDSLNKTDYDSKNHDDSIADMVESCKRIILLTEVGATVDIIVSLIRLAFNTLIKRISGIEMKKELAKKEATCKQVAADIVGKNTIVDNHVSRITELETKLEDDGKQNAQEQAKLNKELSEEKQKLTKAEQQLIELTQKHDKLEAELERFNDQLNVVLKEADVNILKINAGKKYLKYRQKYLTLKNKYFSS